MVMYTNAPATTKNTGSNVLNGFNTQTARLNKCSDTLATQQGEIIINAIEQMDIGILPPKGMYDLCTHGTVDTGEGIYQFSARHVEHTTTANWERYLTTLMNFNRYLKHETNFDSRNQQIRIHVDDPELTFRARADMMAATRWMYAIYPRLRSYNPYQLNETFGKHITKLAESQMGSNRTPMTSHKTKYIAAQLINSEFNLHFVPLYTTALSEIVLIYNRMVANPDLVVECQLTDFNDKTLLSFDHGADNAIEIIDENMGVYTRATERFAARTTDAALFCTATDMSRTVPPILNSLCCGDSRTRVYLSELAYMTVTILQPMFASSSHALGATEREWLNTMPIIQDTLESIAFRQRQFKEDITPFNDTAHKIATGFLTLGDIWELVPQTAAKYGTLEEFHRTGGLILPAYVQSVITASAMMQ